MQTSRLPTSYQEFIHLSRYSRWLPEKKRRETGKLGKDHVSKWLNYNDAIKYAKSKQDSNFSAEIIEKKSSIDHQHIGYIGFDGKFHEGV